MKLNVPNWSKTSFYFPRFNEAFVVAVVYYHCQCCVPKTHLFIPLLLPCTVHKLRSDVSERESEYYVSLVSQKEAHFFCKS